jgi:hypothetical protein
MKRTPPRRLERMVGYHDLLADLGRPGCPMCHGANRSAWRYLDGLLWESVNDPGIRMGLRATHGFCREHWMMALRVASAQSAGSGMAILTEDILRHTLADAEQDVASKAGAPRRRRGRHPLSPEAPCSACVSVYRTVGCYAQVLATAGEGTAPFQASREPYRGVCVPHLALGLEFLRDPVERRRFVEIFRRGSEELGIELKEFSRKQDYRFQHEGLTDGEATSWRRAMYRLVGEPLPTREPPR